MTEWARARHRTLYLSLIANSVLAVEFVRFWWRIADDLPTRAATPFFVAVIVTCPVYLISIIMERRALGEFPFWGWLLAWVAPLAASITVGWELGGVDLVVCVGVGLVGIVLASMGMRRPSPVPVH